MFLLTGFQEYIPSEPVGTMPRALPKFKENTRLIFLIIPSETRHLLKKSKVPVFVKVLNRAFIVNVLSK